MLHTDLKEELKEALKARDNLRLTVIRGLLTAFMNELVATKRKPDEMLSDEEALVVITRAAKQRKDSIEQFTKGAREDLAEKEQAELALLEGYLPEMMERGEVEKIVRAKKQELGVSDPAKKGILMGALMKELKGKADGGVVKEIVEELF